MDNPKILSLIGNTPLLEIVRLAPDNDVKILAKLECTNPGGSIKDRVARAMVEAAEKSGELTPDKTVIEATSGNTGIGLAMVCAVKGYKCTLLMSEAASEERKRIVRAYGADVLLTSPRLGTDGAIEKAYRMAREEPEKYVLVDQYNNEASIQAHYHGTAQEIWDQTGGEVTHVVVCLGTTGTAMGLVKRLKELNPDIRIIAVEPLAGHKIQGLKNMLESYPPGIFDRKALDEVIHVEDEEAFDMCRRLAREEGVFAGMSSGAALAGARKVAKGLRNGLMVVIFPDSGERYLSTPLFAPPAQRGVGLADLGGGTMVHPQAKGASLGLFTVGPNLDNLGGLNAWRRMVLFDVLARYMDSRGESAALTVGLADMDDRSLAACRGEKTGREAFARARLEELGGLARTLGLGSGARFALAGEKQDRFLDMTRKLLARGLAYEKLRSVYFDIARDKEYGTIGRMDVDKLSVGKTVDLAAYAKDDPRDFTLLKRGSLQDLKSGDVMDTEWGNVRPSWFLQMACSALNGAEVDVVLAGEAHMFPHLENLRAIWAAANQHPQAWMVTGAVSFKDMDPVDLAGAMAMAGGPGPLRMWLLSASYHRPLVCSAQSVSMWSSNWRKVRDAALSLDRARNAPGRDVHQEAEQAVFDLKAGLKGAMEEDLSLHHFWPCLFGFIKTVNSLESGGQFTGAEARLCSEALDSVNKVLGLVGDKEMPVSLDHLSEDVRDMVARREEARKAKDWASADELRDELNKAGYSVEDTAQGPRLFPV